MTIKLELKLTVDGKEVTWDLTADNFEPAFAELVTANAQKQLKAWAMQLNPELRATAY